MDELLNVYLDKCLDIISTLDCFSIAHISRHDNWKANELAQQASGYHVDHGMFHISQNPMSCLTSIEEAEPEPTDSVINKKSSQVTIPTGGSPLLLTCVIRVKGWTGLFGVWLLNIL